MRYCYSLSNYVLMRYYLSLSSFSFSSYKIDLSNFASFYNFLTALYCVMYCSTLEIHLSSS